MASLGGLDAFDVYTPIHLKVFSLAMLALMGLPVPLASYRELGVLRRLSTTPMHPSWRLAAQGAVQLCVGMTALAVILTVSGAAFGAPAPASPGGLVVSVALSTAGLFPVGLLVAAAAGPRTARASSACPRWYRRRTKPTRRMRAGR